MPQFDIFSLFVQVFYTILGFSIFFLLYKFYVIKSVSEVIKLRKNFVELLVLMHKNKINSKSNKKIYNTALKFSSK
jgi:hypothetical protein